MFKFRKKPQTPVDKTMLECEAMVNYAMSQGKKIPPHVLSSIERLKLTKEYVSQRRSNEPQIKTFTRSIDLEDGTMLPSEEFMVDELADVHASLSSTIYPAAPSTVVLLESQKKKPLRFMGPVPLVQRMTFIAFLSLITFLGLFMFSEVDSQTVNGNILSYDDPKKFLLNELFILCIAAAGAAFYALFEAYKYISNASYDPKYESIYWIRFILGIMSGVILAQFIFIDPSAYGGSETTAPSPTFITYKPLLAFLGGFSARVVHKILNSLVDSIETFISGSARDMLREREEIAKAKIEEKVADVKRENAAAEASSRLQSALKLMRLQEELNQGADNEMVKEKIQRLIDEQISVLGGPVTGGIPTVPTATPSNNFGQPVFHNPAPNIPVNDPIIFNPEDLNSMLNEINVDPSFPGDIVEPEKGDNPELPPFK